MTPSETQRYAASADIPRAGPFMPTNADLGQAIRRLRRDRHLTIAKRSRSTPRCNPTYLSGIERGVRNPTWDKITSLARALDVTISTIVQTAGRTMRRRDASTMKWISWPNIEPAS